MRQGLCDCRQLIVCIRRPERGALIRLFDLGGAAVAFDRHAGDTGYGYRFYDGSSREGQVRPVATILDRYRRGAAVPAVAAIDLGAELAPVFAALDEIEAEAERLRKAATDRAARRLVAAAEEASAIVADAERRARAERTRAATERRRMEELEARTVASEAEAGARAIGVRAAEVMPELVEAVVACIKESPA